MHLYHWFYKLHAGAGMSFDIRLHHCINASLGHWPHTTSNAFNTTNLLSAAFANTPTTHTYTRDSHYAYNIILNYTIGKHAFPMFSLQKLHAFPILCQKNFVNDRSRIQKPHPIHKEKGEGKVYFNVGLLFHFYPHNIIGLIFTSN